MTTSRSPLTNSSSEKSAYILTAGYQFMLAILFFPIGSSLILTTISVLKNNQNTLSISQKYFAVTMGLIGCLLLIVGWLKILRTRLNVMKDRIKLQRSFSSQTLYFSKIKGFRTQSNGSIEIVATSDCLEPNIWIHNNFRNFKKFRNWAEKNLINLKLSEEMNFKIPDSIKQALLILKLYIGFYILFFFYKFFLITNFEPTQERGHLLIKECLTALVMISFLYWLFTKLSMRKNWARILITISFAINALTTIVLIFNINSKSQILTIVDLLIFSICMTLLWMPSSSRWFSSNQK